MDRAGERFVRVAPITHAAPRGLDLAIEIPALIKKQLGLDAARSWIVLDELNEFVWPGSDLESIRGGRDLAYGFLPAGFFASVMGGIKNAWSAGRGRTVRRT